MEFRIAATFADSVARLTGDVQKAVKTTAFDLPTSANPGTCITMKIGCDISDFHGSITA